MPVDLVLLEYTLTSQTCLATWTNNLLRSVIKEHSEQSLTQTKLLLTWLHGEHVHLIGPAILRLGSLWLIEGLRLVMRREQAIATNNKQTIFALETKRCHSTLSFLHWPSVSVRCWGDVSPAHCDDAQTVQRIVMASIMATPPTKVEYIFSYAGTGIEGHSQRRNPTGGQLTPFSSAKVEDVYNRRQLDLFWISVGLGKRFLPSSPQVDLFVDHSSEVADARWGLVPLGCRGDESKISSVRVK